MDLENWRNLILVVISASVIAGSVFGVIIYEIRAPETPGAIQTPVPVVPSQRSETPRPS